MNWNGTDVETVESPHIDRGDQVGLRRGPHRNTMQSNCETSSYLSKDLTFKYLRPALRTEMLAILRVR